jgi:hypothetical protein
MNKLNVNAVLFWALLFMVGYLAVDVRTGLVAMTCGFGISLLAGMVSR